MTALLRLFVLAEALIRAVLVAGKPRKKTREAVREALAALRVKAVGTPDKPGAAWNVVRDAYRGGVREAQSGPRRDEPTPLGARHGQSAERLFRRLAGRIDAAIAHVAQDVDTVLGGPAVSTEEIPEIKGFTDRAGRRWDLSVYARMVARTVAAEARSEATVNTLIDRGVDLVTVSKHPHPHDVCSRFEGRVYSISGGHPRYTKLRERPPFHPNCRHVLREYRRGDGSRVRPASADRSGRVRVDTDSLAAFLEEDGLFLSDEAGVVRIDDEGRVFVDVEE
jgi:hypothetical protein